MQESTKKYGSMAAKDHWILELKGGAVVLEMSDIPSTDDTELPLPPTTRNVLLLDKRRQQALSKLQSVLKEQASHEELQDAMLTRTKFCTVFQRTVYCYNAPNPRSISYFF